MLEIKNLTKIYHPKKGVPIYALNNISLTLPDTGMVFILGKSGSGKSTLLNVLGGLDSFDSGEFYINGTLAANFKQSHYDSYRNTYIGFIFQEYNILEELTVAQNIALAIELQGRKATSEEVTDILTEVDLLGLATRLPNELSGGQLQRVAIARALVKNPQIIMADEPTGALDSNTSRQIFTLLKKLSEKRLVLIVSHDREYSEQYADRIVELADGVIISDVEKIENGELPVQNPVEITNQGIIIEAGYELTIDDLNIINEYLKHTEASTLLQKSSNNRGYQFVNTNQEDLYKGQKEYGFHLIKSRLSIKNAFTISKGSLKHKRFKLIMTIFLSVVAFTLFGLADTFAAFNKEKTIINSIIDSKIDYAALYKEKVEFIGDEPYYYSVNATQSDVEAMSEKYGINFKGVVVPSMSNIDYYYYGDAIKPDDEETTYRLNHLYTSSISGFVEITQTDLNNYGYRLEGNLPQTEKEILITNYTGDAFRLTGYYNGATTESISAVRDLIGKTITINKIEYTISGVVDTHFNYDKFEPIMNGYDESDMSKMILAYALESELQSLQRVSLNTAIFVKEGTIQSFYNSDDYSFYKQRGSFNLINAKDGWATYVYGDVLSRNKQPITWLVDEKDSLVDHEIILSKSVFLYLIDADESYDFTNLEQVKTDLRNANIYKYDYTYNTNTEEITNITIVGLCESIDAGDYNPPYIIISNAFYEEINRQPVDAYFDFLVGPMPNSRNTIKQMVHDSYSYTQVNHYRLTNIVCEEIEYIDDILLTLSKVFIWIGVFFAIFACLMLANFINNSVHYKKQEIGILRAIGARSIDVFKIFYSESFIIASINYVITIIAVVVAVICINLSFRSNLNLMISILRFGIRQIVIILLITMATAFIATFIPTFAIARKKPIDAIRKR